MDKQKLLTVIGPTATGKSALAVLLAKKYNGEIIGADSRQVYRDLTIGTGKITKKEMLGVRHHLLDVADPKKQFSVSEYVALAEKAIIEIIGRGKIPIVCGGTGFYIDTLLSNTKIPHVPPDKELRKRLEGRSASELYTMLTFLDKERSKSIDAQNSRRLIRAIEIAKHFGAVPPLSPGESKYNVLKIGLILPKEELRKKIRDRIFSRQKDGMIAEVKNLHTQGLSWKRMEALGLEYRYIARHLQKKLTETELFGKLETEIWRYSKRQITWFKRDKKIQWFNPKETSAIEQTVENFLK